MKSSDTKSQTIIVNNVPPGSIMPFVGTIPPEGWLLCNGSPFSSEHTNLLALLPEGKTPNLQGMFLRGTGTNPVNKQLGPALNNNQLDSIASHSHGKGTLATSDSEVTWEVGVGYEFGERPYPNRLTIIPYKDQSSTFGSHNHVVTGETASTGDNETRSVNYGVNYIIKY